jgi:hypothetical protein
MLALSSVAPSPLAPYALTSIHGTGPVICTPFGVWAPLKITAKSKNSIILAAVLDSGRQTRELYAVYRAEKVEVLLNMATPSLIT